MEDESGGFVPVDRATFEQLVSAARAAQARAKLDLDEMQRLTEIEYDHASFAEQAGASDAALARAKVELDAMYGPMKLAKTRR